MGSILSRSRRGESSGEMTPFLQHENVYKITSMKDKNVVEVVLSAGSFGAPLMLKKWSNGSNQKFKATQIGFGKFQIASLNSPNHAWDYQPSNSVVFQGVWNGGENQLWAAEEIRPKTKICLIRSVSSGLCLRNMGGENQLELVPPNLSDPRMHWRLEATY